MTAIAVTSVFMGEVKRVMYYYVSYCEPSILLVVIQRIKCRRNQLIIILFTFAIVLRSMILLQFNFSKILALCVPTVDECKVSL